MEFYKKVTGPGPNMSHGQLEALVTIMNAQASLVVQLRKAYYKAIADPKLVPGCAALAASMNMAKTSVDNCQRQLNDYGFLTGNTQIIKK